MLYGVSKVTYSRSVISAKETTTPVWQDLSPTDQKNITDRMEQWFADIERRNQPHNTETNPYLATQFLSRFGLKNASEVFDFLKTTGGNMVLTMIAREIMHEQSRVQELRERNAEEMLRQQHVLFIIMGLIAKREELAKNVDHLLQLEIDKHFLKEHAEHSHPKISEYHPIRIIEEMIDYYVETINALDKELDDLEQQLDQVEEELEAIEAEEQRIEAYHEALHAHIDILDTYLRIPLLNHPQESPTAFAERRITVLTQNLERYKEQEALFKNTTPDSTNTQNIVRNRLNSHIRTIEHELNFHKVHLSQTATNFEELFRLTLEQTRSQIQELQLQQSAPGELDAQIEGLKLREQGLASALKVMRNKKILLNDQLEQVFDFSQARFIIKPEEAKRLVQKDDGSYALIPKDADPDNLSEEEWLQAKRDFEQAKESIQTPRVNCLEKIQENLQKHMHRKEHHLSLREVLRTQKLEMQRARMEMGETLREAQDRRTFLLSRRPSVQQTSSPKSEPPASYAQMIEKFESLVLKAPKKDDIENARGIVERSSISPKNKGELNKLIEQVAPEKTMGSQQRLQWLYSAKRLIKDTSPTPEADPTLLKKD